MIEGKKILAIIPARGGSKGIPHKNIKPLAGKPLIVWTLEHARNSHYIDRCVVSTEDAEIKSVAEQWGGEVLDRPMELAQDDTPGVAPVLHALSRLPGYDYVVLLQVTSPLRSTEDIDACISMAVEKKADTCVSVTETSVSPYWMYQKDASNVMKPILPIDKSQWFQRQKLPKVYQLNGAVFVADVTYVKQYETLVGDGFTGYVMPMERSYDIDTPIDFFLCEHLIKERA